MIALLFACEGPDGGPGRHGDAEPRPEVQLGDMTIWGAPSVADPFGDIPPDGTCPIGGTRVEGSTFEADTGLCTYVWTEQPLLADLVPGDTIEIVFWHSSLVSDLPAEGHLALAVDGATLYERHVPIPSGYLAYTEQAEVDFEADAGAPLGLHLHNHGANTWNVLRVTRLAWPLED
jgi:hypothetical protein